MTVVDRFLEYVKFDTQSDELTNLTPSTPGQMIFAQHLEKELRSMGLSDITLDDNGYLMATLKGNVDKKVPTVGFIAHLDTSPDMSGKHVAPRIVENYDGGDIVLNAANGIVLEPTKFPELLDYKGQDLIVTDGNTLLGADDKAGIAEIITAVDYLMHHVADLLKGTGPEKHHAHGYEVECYEHIGGDSPPFATILLLYAGRDAAYHFMRHEQSAVPCTPYNVHPRCAMPQAAYQHSVEHIHVSTRLGAPVASHRNVEVVAQP